MNNFLFAYKKTYTNLHRQNLILALDVDLKSNTLLDLQFSGDLAVPFTDKITEIKTAFSHITLDKIPKIKIANSFPLYFFYSTLDEYLGHIPVAYTDVVCLCFGMTKNDIKNGNVKMAGRACGSCRSLLAKKEFVKIADMYPGPLVVKLDELKNEWLKDLDVKLSIEEINEAYLEVKMQPYSKEKLKSLSDYYFEKLNFRFFLRAIL
jgi:hypothetical protein